MGVDNFFCQNKVSPKRYHLKNYLRITMSAQKFLLAWKITRLKIAEGKKTWRMPSKQEKYRWISQGEKVLFQNITMGDIFENKILWKKILNKYLRKERTRILIIFQNKIRDSFCVSSFPFRVMSTRVGSFPSKMMMNL